METRFTVSTSLWLLILKGFTLDNNNEEFALSAVMDNRLCLEKMWSENEWFVWAKMAAGLFINKAL